MKRIFTLLSYLTLTFAAFSQALPGYVPQLPFANAELPKHEVRAVWLCTIGGIDWPRTKATSEVQAERQRQELVDQLDRLQAGGINTVLLQTRIRGTVIYPSSLEPWDICLTGQSGRDPGYDPLQFAIDECHKRGMQLHAYLVTIPMGKWNGPGCKAMAKRYKNILKKIGDEGYLNPEDPRTGGIIAEVAEEIVRRYDVDGIHLDYIRYPETWKITVSRPVGRSNITRIVEEIHRRVKAVKPWVMMSCSPIGKYDDLPRQSAKGWNANTRVCQDAQGWLRDGLMDALFPMMYFRGSDFYPFARDWAENTYGRIVVPGLGIYFMDRKEKNWPLSDITRELEACRQWNMGHCYFRSLYFADNTKGLHTFAREFDRHPALIPPMTWRSTALPDAPAVENDSTQSLIRWSGARDNSGADYLLYNVYSSAEWPVDVSDPRNLVLTRTRQMAASVPLHGRFYAVTAVDRYGNESLPGQNHNQPPPKREIYFEHQGLLTCDGTTLVVNTAASLHLLEQDWTEGTGGLSQLDSSDQAVIVSMQGNIVASMKLDENIDVSHLPDGMYQLRSTNKKGRNRRIGFFQIDRRRKKP